MQSTRQEFSEPNANALESIQDEEAGDYLPSVMDTAGQIFTFLRDVQLDSATTMRTSKVRADLDQIAAVHGLTTIAGSQR
jgi:hypothetical protein